jgi:hypothetical protein
MRGSLRSNRHIGCGSGQGSRDGADEIPGVWTRYHGSPVAARAAPRGHRLSSTQHPDAAPQHFDAVFLEQFPNEQIAIKAGVHHPRTIITLS